MGKKILLATLFTILCGIFCVAQNSISQAEYEKWVDYVNCKYTVAFIDKKIAQNSGEINDKYKNNYTKNKSKLDVSSFDKAVKYKEIKNVIGSFLKALLLSEYINDKKNSLQPDWDKKQIINSLINLPSDQPSAQGNGFKGYLTKTTNSLEKDLQNQISDSFFIAKEQQVKGEQPKQEMVEQTTPDVKQTFDNATKTIAEKPAKSGKSFFVWAMWFCIITLLIALIYYFRNEVKKWVAKIFDSKVKNENKFPEEIEEKVPASVSELEIENKRLLQNIEQWETKNAVLRTENQRLKNKIFELEQQVKEIENKEQHIIEPTIPKIESKTEISEIRKSNKLYAANIIDGIFNKVTEQPNDYSVFELTLLSQSTASFSIYHNAYRRVLAAPEFIEGCDKQILSDTPSNLDIEMGEAQYNNSGKWQVTKKAKIKFI